LIAFFVVSFIEILIASVEAILFIVSAIGIRSGSHTDIPEHPTSIRNSVILILFAAIVLEGAVIAINAYFIWVVWRAKEYLETYEKNPFDNNHYTVSYTNQANNDLALQPAVPATYRI